MNGDNSTRREEQLVEGPVSRHLNRKISRPIARSIKEVSWFTPNRVSVFALLIACLAAAFYSFGNLLIPGEYRILDAIIIIPSMVIGGILVELSSIIDGVDGDLARERGISSSSGAVFDAILDRYADIVILTGITYSLLVEEYDIGLFPASSVGLTFNRNIVFLIFVMAVAGSLMVSYSRARLEAAGLFDVEGRTFFGATRDVRLFIVFVCSLMGYPLLALLLVAFSGNFTVLLRLLSAMQSGKLKRAAQHE